MSYFMGIDLGTSSTKTLIMEENGKTAGIGNASYGIQIPQISYAEQDPLEWWEAVKKSIKKALQEAGIQGRDIAGIGFSGQMHGMVALDENKQLACKAIIHLDQRSSLELKEIRTLAGNLMTEELLNQPSAGMMISSLYWLKKHQKETYDRIRYVMSPKDYISFRLCGEIGTEYTDAGAALGFSVKNYRWCTELFKRLELKEAIWPPVHKSFEIAGNVTAEAAEETGLSTSTKVIYGAGDSMAALTGNGIIESGFITCNIGTSSQLAVVVDKPIFDPKMRIQTWCHTVPKRWVVQSGTLNGGSVLSWLRNNMLKTDETFAQLDQEAGLTPAGADGLYFLPYLAGERTPYNDPYAKGVFFGLSMMHQQGHLVRSAMEGILFNLKECLYILDEMKVDRSRLIASGGAARGVTWKQIQADVLNMPVYSTNVKEEACQGAAILAAVGVGFFKDIKEGCQAAVTMSPEVVEPILENVKIYNEKQEVFHDLYYSVKKLYPRIV